MIQHSIKAIKSLFIFCKNRIKTYSKTSILCIPFLISSIKVLSATYDANGTGAWESSTVWSTVPDAGTLSGSLSWYAISVSGYITRTGSLTIGNNLDVSGTLIVTGNISGSSTLTVKNGGILYIYGNLTSTGLTINVDEGGTLVVLGNTTLNGGNMTINGNFITLGNFSMDAIGATLKNNGNMIVGGNFTFTNGSFTLNGSTPADQRFYLIGTNPSISIASNTSSGVCATQGSSCSYGDASDLLTYDPDLLNYINGILVQAPASVSACTGGSTTLSIITCKSFTYQWQVSTDNGTTFTALSSSGIYSGVTSSSLVISSPTTSMNGYKYRCILTGSSTVTSGATTLTVVSSPVITSQPSNVIACNNYSGATFTVTATGTSLTYQWQYSTDGSTWTNATSYPYYNYTTASLTCASYNISSNILVRCIITNSSGCSVYSNVATYSISKPSAAGTITGTASVCKGQTSVSYSVPAIPGAASYIWTYSGTGATITGSTESISIAFSSSATSGTLTVYGQNTCGNGTAASYSISVNSGPTLSSSANPNAICNNSLFSYTPSSSTSGATFSWSRYAISGISNSAASGTGGINETLINTSTSSKNVVYNYTITSGGCSSTVNVTVTVYPEVSTGALYREPNN